MNARDENNWTALYLACRLDRVNVVMLLLGQPPGQVNAADQHGHTVAHYSVTEGRRRLLLHLVKDPRVDFLRKTSGDRSVLQYAAFVGSTASVQILLASGRDVGDLASWRNRARDVHFGFNDGTATVILDLLARFESDPAQTRYTLRLSKELRADWPEAGAAELFALVVLFCDGYLRSSPAMPHHPLISRFFMISVRLPLELQMLFALRAFRLTNTVIITRHSEPAFRFLLRKHFTR